MLAVLGAVGLIFAAVAVRQALDDDEPSATAGSSVIVCADDLIAQCEAMGTGVEVRAETAAVTAAALADGTLANDVDAWITTSAWLEVVDARNPDALGDVKELATSATVVATAPGRFEAITELCADTDVWACLGEAAGTSWADLGDGQHAEWLELKVGLTHPDTATGLSVLASAAAGFFDGTDFAANDPSFREFEGWLSTLAAPSAAGDPDPARALATRPGTYSAAGSVAALAGGFDARGVKVIQPDTGVSATVVMIQVGDNDVPSTEPVQDALIAAGWARASEGDLAPTLKPGVMAALHSLWRTVTS